MLHCPDCGPSAETGSCPTCGGPLYDLSVDADHVQYTELQALSARSARKERGRRLALGLGATALGSGAAGLLLVSNVLLGVAGLATIGAVLVLTLHDDSVPSTL